MQLQDVLPNVITCNTFISSCGKGRLPKRALEVFKAMHLQGVAPNVIT